MLKCNYNVVLMRNLDELVAALEDRAEDNRTLEAFAAKPKNEDLIIESLLRLATEIQELKKRSQ